MTVAERGSDALSPLLAGWAARASAGLAASLPTTHACAALGDAMRHALLGGGKRLRPLLVYASAHLHADDPTPADAAAAAVEILHAYSLVHDDLPAMDDDDLRRGQPTCHVVYGEAMAILAGDALQALAFEVLTGGEGPDPASRLAMLRVLAQACGPLGMAGGQAIDLQAVGHDLDLAELTRMHALKTGALFAACVRLGLYAHGIHEASWHAGLTTFAHHFGLAFQIHDDVLDVVGDPARTGKAVGSDQAQDKPTFPRLLGVEAAQQLARNEAEAACDALARLPDDSRTGPLRELTRYAVQRDR